jgi:hypothetical protein
MSESAAETIEPVDPDSVLAALAAYWRNPAPARFTNRVPGRIAGSAYDQTVPEGTSNPYWEIVRQIPLDTIGSPFGNHPEPDAYFSDPRDPARLLAGRHALCASFSWSIPSPGDIAWMTARLSGRGIVEPGAGGGYWAWQLSQAGADVIGYDPHPPGAGNRYAAVLAVLFRIVGSTGAVGVRRRPAFLRGRGRGRLLRR